MRSALKPGPATLCVLCVLCAMVGALAACGQQPGESSSTIPFRLTRCDGRGAVPQAGAEVPAAQPAIYASTVGANLYAFAPDTGAVRWCVQFALTETDTRPPGGHGPPLPQPLVGSPLVADGVLYACVSGAGGVVYAFNAADGALRWMRATDCGPGPSPALGDESTPVLADGRLFSGSYVLDPRDGMLLQRLADGIFPAVAADGVLYANTENVVAAWNVQSGKQMWSYAVPDPIGSVPTVANGIVYVGDIGGNSPPAFLPNQPDTFALDAQTGKLLWRAPTGMASGSAAVVGSTVYVGGFGPAMFALDAANGAIRWRHDTGMSNVSTPVVLGGVVYFTADGVYALDAATGALRWRQALGTSQSTWFSWLTMAHSVLYTGMTDGSGQSTLYALSAADGAVLWKVDGLNQISPPVAVE